MDNKTFKEMIKKHLVKQSFVLLNPNGREAIYKLYQGTSKPDKLYCHVWFIKDYELHKVVVDVSLSSWQTAWNKYIIQCQCANIDKIAIYQKALVEAPVQLKKYWKIKIDTVRFMLKDQRVR